MRRTEICLDWKKYVFETSVDSAHFVSFNKNRDFLLPSKLLFFKIYLLLFFLIVAVTPIGAWVLFPIRARSRSSCTNCYIPQLSNYKLYNFKCLDMNLLNLVYWIFNYLIHKVFNSYNCWIVMALNF